MTNDRETVVVSESRGNSAGWIIAGIAIVALFAVIVFAYNEYFSDNTTTIELKVPELLAPNPSNP